ncbi:hypothetical protein [Propioniciclava soli]|uniref:AMIN-like domain-containing protein n=1 Tax=Propioniciclava soli TaxID=2775081 RepID=A0ABZ3C918_9ACTN|nr:hypothetical protein [Propioniciclava soli]
MSISILRRLAVATAFSLTAVLVPLSAATADAASCSVVWGSVPRSAGTMQQQNLVDVRSGQHACFDRIVVDLAGGTPSGYAVRYVPEVRAQGTGDVIALRGGARLEVTVLAPAHDDRGRATYVPANPNELVDVTGHATLRQVAWGGSFEGQSTLGVGVRARLPYRVFVLDDGATSRLVIDVAHQW